MKNKGVSLFAMWEKAAKTKKTTSASTPSAPSVEVECNLQLALVPVLAQDDGVPIDQAPKAAPQPERERGSSTPVVENDEATDEGEEDDLIALERDPINLFQKGDRRVVL